MTAFSSLLFNQSANYLGAFPNGVQISYWSSYYEEQDDLSVGAEY